MKTSRGYEISFVGIATAMDELARTRKKIYPPKFYVPLPGTLDPDTNEPRLEEHYHDETTLETDAEKSAYLEYLTKVNEDRLAYNERALKLTLLKGVKVEIPDLTQWKAERVYLGLDVPEDELSLKFLWIYTEVIGTIEDLRTIQDEVANASGVSEEKISATEESFRHSLGSAGGNGTNGSENTADGSDVVLLSAVQPDQGGDREPSNGKRVRRAKRK